MFSTIYEVIIINIIIICFYHNANKKQRRMKMSIVKKIKKFCANQNNESRVNYLRQMGSTIGCKDCILAGSINAFGSEPYLIHLGNSVTISLDVELITHDGSLDVLNKMDKFNGQHMDRLGEIRIGDNVFIGAKSIIMPGIKIGSNSIIAAGSIVTKGRAGKRGCDGLASPILYDDRSIYGPCQTKEGHLSDARNEQGREKKIL